MKARNISDNIRLLFDVIDHANHEKMPGAVLSVDLHKIYIKHLILYTGLLFLLC